MEPPKFSRKCASRAFIFALIWTAYGSTYLLRKPFGVIKASISREFSVTRDQLGYIDISIMLPYAMVSLLCGWVGDKLGPRLTLGFGLLVSAFATLPMGICGNYKELLCLLFLSGASQALCWPACCSLISSWFDADSLSKVFGAFGTTCFVGGLLGTTLTVVLNEKWGWRGVFMVPALVVGGMGVIVLLAAKTPTEQNKDRLSPLQESLLKEKSASSSKMISLKEAFKLPLVCEVSLAMFSVKTVRYALMFWLPLYMQQSLLYTQSQAGLASLSFEIGGTLGSALSGILVDKFLAGKSLLGSTICALGSSMGLISLVMSSTYSPFQHFFSLVIAGAFNSALDILLVGSVATKIGEPHNAVSAVTGVINGVGSLGTVLEGPVVAAVSTYFDWSSLMALMVFFSLFAGLCTYKSHIMQERVAPYNHYQSLS